MSPMVVWYLFFFAFLSGFAFIVYTERGYRFSLYALFGALFGLFAFDMPSVALGYYAYPEHHYLFMLNGVPLTMALAEGFCVAIAIYVYEKMPFLLKKIKKR